MKIYKKLIFAILTVVIVVLGAAFILWPRAQRGYSGKMESITIGTAPLESSALIYIAEDRRHFTDNGLSVTIRSYDTGASAFDGLLKGEVDIASPAEYPLIGAAFKGEKVRAIASIDKVSYFYLIGRKDRGIKEISHLKGKKIGVVRKTIAEFFLGRFLNLNGLRIEQVTLVEVNPSRSEDAIIKGDVDAILSRPPYVSPMEERLGVNAVIWPAQSGQALYTILIGRNDWIEGHPETIKRLLRSLAQAEEYLIRHPDEAKAVLRKKLNLTDPTLTKVRSENQFFLSLDQSLITAMEDQARWMIANKLTSAKEIPDFLNYIYVDGLNAVKPEAVNIFR
jgi:NitT/TauT family transport system substrate-binding protein